MTNSVLINNTWTCKISLFFSKMNLDKLHVYNAVDPTFQHCVAVVFCTMPRTIRLCITRENKPSIHLCQSSYEPLLVVFSKAIDGRVNVQATMAYKMLSSWYWQRSSFPMPLEILLGNLHKNWWLQTEKCCQQVRHIQKVVLTSFSHNHTDCLLCLSNL